MDERGNIGIIIAVVGGVILVILGFVGYTYVNSQKSAVETTTLTPTPTPIASPKKATKKIDSIEEAMSYALTASGLENADTAKVRGIKMLYTATMKSWTFDFSTRSNPHPSPKTGATVYDESWNTVKVNNSGDISLQSGIVTKDVEEGSAWKYMAKPAEAAMSSNFELARQKVIGAGLTPGTIIQADFSSTGYAGDTSGYNNQWKIAVVLAGEEGNQQKKAKTVSIMGGKFKELYDSVVYIY